MYCFGSGNKCCFYFYEVLFYTQVESFPLFCELLTQADPLWQEKKLCYSGSLLIAVITVKKAALSSVRPQMVLSQKQRKTTRILRNVMLLFFFVFVNKEY